MRSQVTGCGKIFKAHLGVNCGKTPVNGRTLIMLRKSGRNPQQRFRSIKSQSDQMRLARHLLFACDLLFPCSNSDRQ